MAWFKVDDGFYSSRKVLSIPRSRRFEALGLWTACGAWTMKELTDGFVPREIVDELGGLQSQINDLVAARLWLEEPEGYRFHDWHDYQPTAKDIKQNRAETSQKRAKAGRIGAQKRWQDNGKNNGKMILLSSKTEKDEVLPRKGEGENVVTTNQEIAKWQSDSKADGKRIAPTQPNPNTEIDESISYSNDGKKARAHTLPKDWKPNESHSIIAANDGLDLVIEALQFRNHAEATGRVMKNWDAAFRVWLVNAVKWRPSKPKLAANDDWMNQ